MKNKIIIGCANFGNTYGLKKKILNQKKIFDIVFQAKKLGINHFDTAHDYNKSEVLLGESISKVFKKKKIFVDTKLPKKFNSKTDYVHIEKVLISSLNKLKINEINTLYIHDSKQILKQNNKKLYSNLLKLKKKKLIKKLGVSVYTPKELLSILQNFKIDVIQVPINILDKRFLNSIIINIVKKKKVEFIARSIFLKSLLIKKPSKYRKIFSKNKKIYNFLVNFSKKGEKKAVKDCVQFVKDQKIVNKLILGVSNKSQLTELANFMKTKKKPANFKVPNIEDQRLLDPRSWVI